MLNKILTTKAPRHERKRLCAHSVRTSRTSLLVSGARSAPKHSFSLCSLCLGGSFFKILGLI